MDNVHGHVAHSPWVPTYSTLFLILKSGIIIVPSIYLTSQSNRKDQVLVVYFHHGGTMTCQSIVCRTSKFYYANCPFNTYMLVTSARSFNSLPLVPGHQGWIYRVWWKNSLQNNCPPPNKNQQSHKQRQPTTQERIFHCMVIAPGSVHVFETN